MRHESSRWKLSYGWLRGEDYWGDPVSQNFVLMDLLMHPFAKTMNENSPPAALTIGDQYVVGKNPVAAWANHKNDLAVYTENGWVFCTPMQKGLRIGCEAPAGWYYWDGTDWVDEAKNAAAPPSVEGQFYDVIMWVGFAAEPLEEIGGIPVPEDMTWPAGALDSVGRAKSTPAIDVVISVMRNFTEQVGTITFKPESTIATFQLTQDAVFAKGDAISFQTPINMPEFFASYGATVRLVLNRTGD